MKTIQSYSIVPTLLAVLFGIQLSAFAASAPPERMTYQGFLVDGNGAALGLAAPQNYDVIFRIFTDQTDGTQKWAEQQTVTVDKGYFSVLLGEGSQAYNEERLDLSTVFKGADASERYIQITVKGIGPDNSDVHILPRLKLVTSPYAFLATQASALVDSAGVDMVTVTAGTGISVNGAVTAATVTAATVNAPTVTATTVTATTINASTVTGNGTIPIGGIIMWSGSTAEIPSGWALCNGNKVSGHTTPNLQDRFVVGAGSGYTVNVAGGATQVTLNPSQMPTHTHIVAPPSADTTPSGEHAHGYRSGYGSQESVIPNLNITDPEVLLGLRPLDHGTTAVGDHQHSVDIDPFPSLPSLGGDHPHENRPPYYALAFIMRVQ